MALQNAAVNLQGGGGLSLQGSTYNPQPAANISLYQNAAGRSSLDLGNKAINNSQALLNQGVPQYQDQTASINALLAQIKAQQNVVAPFLNTTSIYQNAYNAANAPGSTTNNYYAKKLSDFQSQQAQAKAIEDRQNALTLQQLQDKLTNTLQGNELSRTRGAADTLLNEQQAGIQQDRLQQDQGTQFDQQRIAQAKQLASSGLTTSGIGGQQVDQATQQRNLTEGRQAEDAKAQFQAQELLKARNFEDLSNSDVLAGTSKATGEKQAKIDFDNFVQKQSADLLNTTNSYEDQRQQKLQEEARGQSRIAISNFINNISNPQQRQAALNAYGSAFS